MAIHSENQDVILHPLRKPAFRICVNTPHSRSIGLTTGLDPAMTLGCGGWGGNITRDNISPRHLLNIKRLAHDAARATVSGNGHTVRRRPPSAAEHVAQPSALPQAPGQPEQRGIQLSNWRRGSTSFSPREVQGAAVRPGEGRCGACLEWSPPAGETAVEFVCEEDVRAALSAGRKLPSARKRSLPLQPATSANRGSICSGVLAELKSSSRTGGKA